MLTDLNHLTLAVNSVNKSFAFYTKILGFKPLALWNNGAYLQLGSLWLCFIIIKKDQYCYYEKSNQY
ncbi:VOC family protein [Proteus columbae]|uniref:VOC family protein n=1 Tax=Proteus columbae TaxID=1987580 RepID=UPI000C1F38D0